MRVGVGVQLEKIFVGPLPVRSKRGKVVLLLVLPMVRSEFENCQILPMLLRPI